MGLIVVQRTDGRGGIKPFGTYGKEQAGAKVYIGERELTVTKDGRVNIPKSIMKQGIQGTDGRYRLEISFRTNPGIDHWKQVQGKVQKPFVENKDAETGTKATYKEITKAESSEEMIAELEGGLESGEITPRETGEKNWS